MNLIIDIGNTLAKLVAFDGDIPVEEVRTSNTTLAALPDFFLKYPFKRGIVGTVFDLTEEVKQRLSELTIPLLFLNAQTPIPIKNHYRTANTLGTDRLAAAVGAYTQAPGRNILVIDAGTCLTYEYIDKQGGYWGGNITSGLQMRLKALHAFTARLPLIDSEGDVPEIGYNTETAIRAGVIQGIKFEIEGYIKHFKEKYPDLLVFLTGGDNFNFDSTIKSIIFADKFIVPRGLNRILIFNNDTLQNNS